jgi:hypothetical protein
VQGNGQVVHRTAPNGDKVNVHAKVLFAQRCKVNGFYEFSLDPCSTKACPGCRISYPEI